MGRAVINWIKAYNLTRTPALGLWEGLSHSASLRSIVIVLKVVDAKTKKYETTSFLSNHKYEFKYY